MRFLRLPEVLVKYGLSVEVVPGWETRGSESFNPAGAVSHWTAGPRTGDRPSLKISTDGRSDLPGPLCNVFLTRSGTAIVVASGRANHAGKGSWRGITGNSSVFGTEAECAGDGNWTEAQRWAYPRVNAAYCELGGFGPEMLCGHSEWAPGRKIDIRDWPMSLMRQQVAELLESKGVDQMKPEQELKLDAILAKLDDIIWVRHADIDAPLDVVVADIRRGQLVEGATWERLFKHLDTDALAQAVAEAVVSRLSAGATVNVEAIDPDVIARAVRDEFERRPLT